MSETSNIEYWYGPFPFDADHTEISGWLEMREASGWRLVQVLEGQRMSIFRRDISALTREQKAQEAELDSQISMAMSALAETRKMGGEISRADYLAALVESGAVKGPVTA